MVNDVVDDDDDDADDDDDNKDGRCNRDKPPCKYFHPPQHLKDQLLINGRNHLALKNALMQQMGIAPGQPVIPGQVPQVATNPYLTGIPANTYSPYFAPGHLVPALLGPDPTAVSQLGPVVPQAVQVAQQKIPRSDRLEVCREFLRGACKRAESECRFAHPQESVSRHDDGSITVCMDAVKANAAAAAAAAANAAAVAALTLGQQHPLEVGKKRAADTDMFQLAYSGMVPIKRPAAEKSGIPVYPGATTYQQLMQLQQPFVPVSFSNNYNSNDQEYDSENNNKNTNSKESTTSSSSSSSPSSLSTTEAQRSAQADDVRNDDQLSSGITTSSFSSYTNNATTITTTAAATNPTSSSNEILKYVNGGGSFGITEKPATNGTTLNNYNLNGSGENITAVSAPTSTHTSSYLNGYAVATSHNSTGILPTPPPTSSVVTNAYQAQQNMQRLYQQSYNAAVANSPYGNIMATYGHQTPVSSTSVSSYSTQAITVPSYTYAGSTPTAYGYSAYPSAAQAAAAANATNYYADAAALAKEVAQKNYANALKVANANATSLTGKPLTAAAAAYPGMAINKAYMAAAAAAAPGQQVMAQHAAFMQAQVQAHQAHQQQQQQQAAVAAMAGAQMRSYGTLPSPAITPTVSTPVHAATGSSALLQRPPTAAAAPSYYSATTNPALLRGQPSALLPAGHNAQAQYAAAAAAMQQQQQQQAAFFFPGMMAPASGYPFAAMGAIPTAAGLPTGMAPTAAQLAAASASTAQTNSALVLNPYKKMKTS
ncbi:hypothetical protein DOY81_006343 [Sarcophaga bullata]|nr:hypothetical protein DOY81_006343 [Sarcophaga bullata]